MKSLIVLLLATLSAQAFSKGCFIELEKKVTNSSQTIRFDFIKNQNQWWASQVEVKSSYLDPASSDNSVQIEQFSKLKDSKFDNNFKVFKYNKTTGEVSFKFSLPRGSITRVVGVPGISNGRLIASDWMSFGIKDIDFNSVEERLSAVGGTTSDSRNWALKAIVSKECFN